MPLEDLTGNKYIGDLNEAWPLGSDLPSAGDDHLRGIKNVLKKTFPGLNGPVTLTQDELNRGSVPAGARMLFYNDVSPAGWVRVAWTDSHMVRIVADTEAGGVTGGTDDPVLNDKVPSHTHEVSGTTAADGAHAHSANSSAAGSHTHIVWNTAVPGSGIVCGAGCRDAGITTTSEAPNHTHTITVFSNGNHTHAFSAISDANADPANWTPRYADCILCEKS